MSFDLDGYVDVPERIRRFKAEHPKGFLKGEGEFVRNGGDEIIGYLYVAQAWTSPDEGIFGVGTAYEPIPGKTPYTKDSEVMNAETSAWGRAIQALGFDFGAVASREEVRNRQSNHAPTTNGSGEFVFTSGKYEGKTLGEVPRDYLDWYLDKGPRDDVKEAIRRFAGEPVAAGAPSDDDIPF